MAEGFGEVAEHLRRSTVQVRIDRGRGGSGSGVIWDAQGRIISNAHVVRGERVEVEFWNGEVVHARILRRDPRRDLAMLSVDSAEGLVPRWTDSTLLHRGDAVIAVGNPLGFVGALSTGVVHDLGPLRGLGNRSWIQARIQLAPGNSGGAMADATGGIVGINTMVAGPLGLAVPSNEVARFVRQGPRLGITVEEQQVRVGAQPRIGFRIQQVMPESRAEQASLLAGDVIIGINGEFFSAPEELEERLSRGGLVRVEFLRGANPVPREVHVPLGNAREERLRAAA